MSEPPRVGNIGLPDNMQILAPEDVPDNLVAIGSVPRPQKIIREGSLTTIAVGAVVGALAIWAVPKAADFAVGMFSKYRDGFDEGSEPYYPDDGGPPFDMDVEE